MPRYRTGCALERKIKKGKKTLKVWYARIEIEPLLREHARQLRSRQVQRTEKALAKARTRDHMSTFSKLTQRVNGRREIVDESPLIVPLRVLVASEQAQTMAWLHDLMRAFRSTGTI